MEETISLKELLHTLKKRMFLILSITCTAVLLSTVFSLFFLTPIYQSSTQLLVNQAKSDQPVFNPSEIQTNLQLINTYNVIIKSPAILDLVRQELDLDLTADQLDSKITVASEKESQVIAITVQDPDPYTAADIANTTAKVFQNEIVNIMNVDNVSVLAKASVKENVSPVKPNTILNAVIAFIVGITVSIGLAFLLEYLDNTIKNEQDVEQSLEAPLLGVISVIEDSGRDSSAERTESIKNTGGESVV
ncbi:YveK family protein [Cytobacillus oceanisediminis]|uniref:YveK family protein n=1 Tax=Cytobacillus oceanisediminis TaxID=665099 RepID=UPI00203EE8C0|nr:Wzz/FepE/Etk N-terminal domain-containing protein [Cytobacillus oceanisediminis]MCM3403615.1 Wzz/FepE/Etk N-terminal domain-containing protein [Cytobacillus oceanisediminis]MDK7666880.1 Wzz/FepE/Etk N-terminal domain-containing protein [Cytobacillus oceanisediminis]